MKCIWILRKKINDSVNKNNYAKKAIKNNSTKKPIKHNNANKK